MYCKSPGVLVLAVLTGFSFSCGRTDSDNDREKPNVIVVMTDDQGYGDFSCNGNPLIHTPNVDRLAHENISFTDFHVAPMCTPTRGQLMTGLDAFRNGAVNVSSGRTLLRPELETMADVFSEAGYHTGLFGKWHLGDNYPFRPEDRGFDEAIWFPSSHINSVPDFWDNDYFDDTYIHNGKREKYAGYCTDVFFSEAISWIDKVSRSNQPFFSYIPLNAAHSPHFVPEEYRNQIRESFAKHPEIVKDLGEGRKNALVSFLAMGLNIDENFGKLLQFLEDADLDSETIVVFLTDNGSTFGHLYYNAGMRGRKTQLWEGGHRVPLYIRTPPGMFSQPLVIDELCQVQDLLPTLSSMAGIDHIPGNLDGMDLTPLIKGEKKDEEGRMLVINYSRMPGNKVSYTDGNPAIPQKNGAAVLWKNWRLLENRELYDLDLDPHQDRDVAGKHPEIARKMSAHLDEWWNEVESSVLDTLRVVIGHEAENPMMITACEWLNVFVDQQKQVRLGVRKNGTWHIIVDRRGRYRFEMRRWPRESGLAIRDSLSETTVTDGILGKGFPLDIHTARIRIGEQEKFTAITGSDQSAEFIFDLEQGESTLQTWFDDRQGEPVCGAYYLYISRLQE